MKLSITVDGVTSRLGAARSVQLASLAEAAARAAAERARAPAHPAPPGGAVTSPGAANGAAVPARRGP